MSLSPSDVVALLRQELAHDRANAWAKVAPLVPDPALRTLLVSHSRLLKRLRPSARKTATRPDRRSRATVCACRQPLPHPPRVKGLPADQRAILGRCFKYHRLRAWVKKSWRWRDTQSRYDRTAPARAARREKDLARWRAQLDPRIVATLGLEQALRQFVRTHNSRTRPSRRLKDSFGD